MMIASPPIPPSEPGQTLFTPGISAHSKNGSFFGYARADEVPLRYGQMVTLLCDDATYNRVSAFTGGPRSTYGDITISLADCIFQRPSKGNDQADEATSTSQPPAPIERRPPVSSVSAPTQEP
jgi:hypothetical protein